MGNASLKQGIWPHKRHREVVSVTHDNTQLWGVFCKSSDQCRPKPGPPGAILLDTRELWTDRPLLSLSRHSQAPGTFWENTINPYITIKASKNRALVTNPKMSTHSWKTSDETGGQKEALVGWWECIHLVLPLKTSPFLWPFRAFLYLLDGMLPNSWTALKKTIKSSNLLHCIFFSCSLAQSSLT